MRNNGLFSTLFPDDLKDEVKLVDMAKGRMPTWGTPGKTARQTIPRKRPVEHPLDGQ